MEELLKEIASIPKSEIFLMKMRFGNKWDCHIKLTGEGLDMDIKSGDQDTSIEAVRIAYDRAMKVVKSGAPELLRQIEHQPKTEWKYGDEAPEVPF